LDKNFYSAPHATRGKELRAKVSANLVEVFLDLDLLAVHAPENSRAYREATPQMVLAQARFSHPELHALVDELFQQDTLANLRRAQGLVRKAYSVIQADTRERAAPWIAAACLHLRRFGRVRVQRFEELIAVEKKKSTICPTDREITRAPGNPMVRGHGTRKPAETSNVPTQLSLV
jgi:hypothetical protein